MDKALIIYAKISRAMFEAYHFGLNRQKCKECVWEPMKLDLLK